MGRSVNKNQKERKMKRKPMLAFALMMIAMVALLTTSCAKQTMQSQTETNPQQEAPVASEEPAAPIAPAEAPAEEAAAPTVTEAAIVNEKIYFGFDSAALSDQAPPILTQMADYLRTNPDLRVTVQGHCDERGTEAYNLDLGARRAQAVKMFLIDQGIQTDRLATMSYGEAQPEAMGHSEASWAQNRRAEFVVN